MLIKIQNFNKNYRNLAKKHDFKPYLGENLYFLNTFGFISNNYEHRYLNPALGRWINRDPIEEEGGSPNLLAFCRNRAMNLLDVDGRSELASQTTAGGVAGYVASAVFGASTSAVFSIFTQMGMGIRGADPANIDWGKVGIDAAFGAAGGLIGSGLGQLAGASLGAARMIATELIFLNLNAGVFTGMWGGIIVVLLFEDY